MATTFPTFPDERTKRSKLSQDKRVAEFTTPLGKDELALVRFDGTEGISQLFEYRIEALSDKPDLNFDKGIGRQCSLKIKTYLPGGAQSRHEGIPLPRPNQPPRPEQEWLQPPTASGGAPVREFNGILVEAQWLGIRQDMYSYRLILRPWPWLLAHTTDCRIWLGKKVPDIIKEVFQDRGFTEFELKLTDGSYPEREYCVQYRETDLNFVSRLMERTASIIISNTRTASTCSCWGTSSRPAIRSPITQDPFPSPWRRVPPPGGTHPRMDQRAEIPQRKSRAERLQLRDAQHADVEQCNGIEQYERSKMEHYDYPGKYKEKSIGERYAKIRLEAEQALDHRRRGTGDAISLFPGGRTELEKHPQDSQNIDYLIVRANHTFVAQSYRTSGSYAAAEEPYYGSYEFQPSDRPYRSLIVTPKPLIHGIQTAKVVCKDDGSTEEIDVEKLTEIYVRFHWDRKKKRSCKVRCAQMWSGKKWGGQFIPRVGQEAVIEFLEGDPDRPLVVGTVYNDENKPPYDLPRRRPLRASSRIRERRQRLQRVDFRGQEEVGKDHASMRRRTSIRPSSTRRRARSARGSCPPRERVARDRTEKRRR